MTPMNKPEGLYEAAGRRRGEQRFLIVLGVIGLAVTLILASFFMGRLFSEGSTTTAEPGQQQEAEQTEPGNLAEAALGGAPPSKNAKKKSAKPKQKPQKGRLTGKAYRGPRALVAPRVAKANCRAKDSVDAGGRKVSYAPMNMIDQRRGSAWRCNGDGRGQKVRFEFPKKQRIVVVGMIPGYAKTDPVDNTDRYRENRRIKRVRWSFDGGRHIVQKFDHKPGNRSLQRLQIPAVETKTVTVEILGSTKAKRNTVAVSKAFFAAAR